MAMKIRCMEYNIACARMKKDAPRFTKPGSNAWRLVPDTTIHISDKAGEAAEDARSCWNGSSRSTPALPGPCSPSAKRRTRSA